MAKGYISIFKSAKFAINGLQIFWKSEFKSKIHLAIAAVVTVLGFYFEFSRTEWMIQCLCIFVVLSTEIVNTSIEELVDHLSPEWSEPAGRIKDLAAGAVLIASIGAVIIGFLLYFPHLSQLF